MDDGLLSACLMCLIIIIGILCPPIILGFIGIFCLIAGSGIICLISGLGAIGLICTAFIVGNGIPFCIGIILGLLSWGTGWLYFSLKE